MERLELKGVYVTTIIPSENFYMNSLPSFDLPIFQSLLYYFFVYSCLIKNRYERINNNDK